MTASDGCVPRAAPRPMLCIRIFTILFCMGCACSSARADRIVLAPKGSVLGPAEIAGELAISGENAKNYKGWLGGGFPGDLGLEVEATRYEFAGLRREALGAQYLIIPEGLTNNIAPTLSLGVRDILNGGIEGRAFYAAASKTFGLSKRQESLLRYFKVHGGYGSGSLGGLYVGVEGRFSLGFIAAAEYVAHRTNASVAVPLGRMFSARAYLLDGRAFYGGSVRINL